MTKTFQITISGQVQGVGFRPFVYQLAKQFRITGTVSNNENGVLIQLNAAPEKAHVFMESILQQAPPIARVQSHQISEIQHRSYTDFNIIPSETKQQISIPLTPDFAICEVCKVEIRNPINRRFGYAFTTCTNCGPRYAVTTSFPFERRNTTIFEFEMCSDCQTEYTHANDRRFHSQTNSCPTCGIQLQLQDQNGDQWVGSQKELLLKTANLIQGGHIIAIKNTNGYLLCCAADNPSAIAKLRRKKQRPEKPFALVYKSLEQIEKSFDLCTPEVHALTSAEAPIVILNTKNPVADVDQGHIAPRLNQLGVMLPSSALLTLLMDELKTPIVATSGNIHGSPIISKSSDAVEKLSVVADYFLNHNLEISFPQDDSLVRFAGEQQIILRRSRGMAPNYLKPLDLQGERIVAMGAHLKSTFTIVPNNLTYVSPYFGNLDNYEVLNRFAESISKYEVLFDVKPETVLVDSHPQYQSTILGRELSVKWRAKLVSIQHHKAHFASVLGEHDLFRSQDKILGIVWDGTGLGDDQAIWGGDFFHYGNNRMDRLVHFDYVDWLAADKMAKEPRLSLLSFLPETDRTSVRHKFSETEWKIYTQLLERNERKTSSVGRLFDAITSLLGLLDISSYEGQAAMLLESQARNDQGNDPIDFLDGIDITTIPTRKLVHSILKAKMEGMPVPQIAHGFIHTLALLVLKIAKRHNYKIIACSGGVFSECHISQKTVGTIEKAGGQVKIKSYLV